MAATTSLVLTAASTIISSVGTVVSSNAASAAAKAEGKSARDVGGWQAAQLRQRAGQERAAAQQTAIAERRKSEILMSRARALGAATGGGDDPTMLKLYSDLAAEGEYSAQAALYGGEEAAKGLEMDAAAAEYSGEAAHSGAQFRSAAMRRAGAISGVGNLLSGGANFFEKYSNPADVELAPTATFAAGGGTIGRTRANWG